MDSKTEAAEVKQMVGGVTRDAKHLSGADIGRIIVLDDGRQDIIRFIEHRENRVIVTTDDEDMPMIKFSPSEAVTTKGVTP